MFWNVPEPQQTAAFDNGANGDGVVVQPRHRHERRCRVLGRGRRELDLQTEVRESHQRAGVHQEETSAATRR